VAPINLVAAILGPGSIATTGLYAHARPSDSWSRYLAASARHIAPDVDGDDVAASI
jgi:hypothetical protein